VRPKSFKTSCFKRVLCVTSSGQHRNYVVLCFTWPGINSFRSVVCEYKLVLQVKIFCLVIGVMEEQRVAIKFCVKAGKSAVETIELINKAYGNAAMSRAVVYRWYMCICEVDSNITSPCSYHSCGHRQTESLYQHFIFVNGCTRWLGRLRNWVINREVAGSIPNNVTGIFHWHNPSGSTMVLG
jgi:hypothetical protein